VSGEHEKRRWFPATSQFLLDKTMRIITFPAIIIFAVFSALTPVNAGDFQVFKNSVLKESDSNDGDSFHVMAGNRHLLVRLYFVDCPETSAWAKSDARRLGEQMRYFGLPSVVDTVHFGKLAAKFTKAVLSEPFTLYTSFATAPGRSSVKRIYGFIETAKGDDLASLLVKSGLARTYGVRRKTPRGVTHDEMAFRLEDMEVVAMLKRNGIWARSDPERIVELRAQIKNSLLNDKGRVSRDGAANAPKEQGHDYVALSRMRSVQKALGFISEADPTVCFTLRSWRRCKMQGLQV
jgi:endonuclease YncB( thermonuclease family)